MCKTDGAAWRNSVMVDFSPGARSPRGTTARVVARGSYRDALSTRDCFTNTKTSKKSAAHPYIHMDWRVQRLASGLYIDYVSNTDSNSGYHSAVPAHFDSDESSKFYITSRTKTQEAKRNRSSSREKSKQKKRRLISQAPYPIHVIVNRSIVFVVVRHCRSILLLLRLIGDHRLGRDHQAGNRRRILQRDTDDLGGVDDSCFDEIFIVLGGSIKAERAFTVLDLVENDSAIGPGVAGDPAKRLRKRRLNDPDAHLLIFRNSEITETRRRADQSDAAAWNNSLFHRRAGSVQRIFHTCLFLFHFDFSSCADFDHGYATG